MTVDLVALAAFIKLTRGERREVSLRQALAIGKRILDDLFGGN